MSDTALSFCKDALYGAAIVIVCSSTGLPQWRLALVHVLSVPGIFWESVLEEGVARTLAVLCSSVTVFADVVTLLTLSCAFTDCCAGRGAPVFAPFVPACSKEAAAGQFVTALCIATIVFGVVVGVARVASAGGLSAGLAAFGYCVVRAYQLTWPIVSAAAGGPWLLVPSALWILAFVPVAIVAVTAAFPDVVPVADPFNRLVFFIALICTLAIDVAALFVAISSQARNRYIFCTTLHYFTV